MDCSTPSSLSFTISQSLLICTFIESVMLSNNLIVCCPLLLLPSTFSNELALPIRWPEYWSFSFSISPSNEYSGLISFRIDCFDLLAVQGTLKSLLQHHNSKTSILHHSAFFMVQLSCLYMTTGKTTALTIWTFVSRVMPLLFNPLSRFAIAFLLRSKYLLMGNPKSLPPQYSPLYSQQQKGLRQRQHHCSFLLDGGMNEWMDGQTNAE